MAKRYVELKYGLIIGIGVCLWVLAEFLLGFHADRPDIGKYSTYFAFIIPLVFYYLAIKEKRDRVLNGSLRLSQGLKTSFLIGLLSGLIIALFMFVYINWIHTEFVQMAVEKQVNALRQEGLTEEELVTAATGMFVLMSAPVQAIFSFVGVLAEGIIIGFVYSLFLKRKTPVVLPPPSTPETMPAMMPEPEPDAPLQDIVTDLHISTPSDENTIPGGPSA